MENYGYVDSQTVIGLDHGLAVFKEICLNDYNHIS